MENNGIKGVQNGFSDDLGIAVSLLLEKRNNRFVKRLLGSAGAIGLSAIVYAANTGEMLFEGKIGEYNVSYEEGTASGNVMKITQGRRTYLFSDNVGQTSIKGGEVKFDGLESLAFFDGDRFISYTVTDDQESLKNPDAYGSNRISRNDSIAVQADVLYNNNRKIIFDRIKR